MMAVEKKRQFSLACTLLSRMVKEKQGCFNGIHRPTTTMNLLPGIDLVSDTKEEEEKSESLTIFYGGNVFVFDNFPEEKAKVLMQMAKNVSPQAQAQAQAKLKHSTDMMLAQTRKDSLYRFLNKRKERINAKAPYQVQGGSLKKKKMGAMAMAVPEETRPWLALGQ